VSLPLAHSIVQLPMAAHLLCSWRPAPAVAGKKPWELPASHHWPRTGAADLGGQAPYSLGDFGLRRRKDKWLAQLGTLVHQRGGRARSGRPRGRGWCAGHRGVLRCWDGCGSRPPSPSRAPSAPVGTALAVCGYSGYNCYAQPCDRQELEVQKADHRADGAAGMAHADFNPYLEGA